MDHCSVIHHNQRAPGHFLKKLMLTQNSFRASDLDTAEVDSVLDMLEQESKKFRPTVSDVYHVSDYDYDDVEEEAPVQLKHRFQDGAHGSYFYS